MKYFYYHSVFVFVLLALTTFARAAEGDLTLEVFPPSPQPGAAFTVRAQSFAFDTAKAQFRWLVNGKETISGAGITEQTYALGGPGSELDIRVVAVSGNGDSFQAEATVAANEIDLIMTAGTVVPAGYRGVTLPSSGSLVQIDAIPHLFSNGVRQNTKNLIYTWSLDREPILVQSGKGKSDVVIQMAQTGNAEHTVGLSVSSSDGSVVAEKTIRVKTVRPEVVVYQTSALTGKKSFTTSRMVTRPGQTVSLVAEPYFFDMRLFTKMLGLWTADGSPITTESGQDARTLQISIPENASPLTTLLFQWKNSAQVFQRAESSITIITQ